MSLWVVVIVFCATVYGQTPSPVSRKTEEPTGTISGKIVNESGHPLPGATTFVREIKSATAGRATISDAEGNFRVSELKPGLYTVVANVAAYASIPPDQNAPTTYYRIGDSVRVELVRGGVITGSVTNAFGEPVIAVPVRASMVRDARGQAPMPLFGAFMEQPTDDRGIYRLYGLAPGTYLVSAGGFAGFQSYQFNPYDSDLPTYAPSSTRDDAAEVSVRAGEESNVDIRYRGEPGYTVSGTVKVSGSSGASVMLVPVGSFMPSSNTFQAPGSRGFAFNGVGDGDYYVIAQEVITATTPSATTPSPLISEKKRVTVKGASVAGIVLVPKPLASISGRILLEPSTVPECQGKRAPIFAETLVQLKREERDSEQDTPYSRMFARWGSPESNGAFTLRNVSPGKYQFEPLFYARYWYFQSITVGPALTARANKALAKSPGADAAANWTVVKAGDQLSNVNIRLAQGAASLRGRLIQTDRQARVLLYLVPAEQDKAEAVLRFFVTEIDTDGTFALNNLAPGRYWLTVQEALEPELATMTKLRAPEAAAARAKLRLTAETQKTEIQLKPCQNLTDYEIKL